MHIISGMLIAALSGLRKKDGTALPASLPKYRTGPVQTLHFLPGRVRFHVPLLKDREKERAMIRDKMPRIRGIESVEVNERSGTILIRYLQKEIRPELIFAAIVRLLGLEKELEKPPRPLVTRELREIGHSLNRAVYEKSGGIIDLWSSGLIILAAAGMKKLLEQGWRSLPAGVTMIWWAVNGFSKRRID